MANLKDSPNFEIYDDYYTPKSAWIKIQHLIPKNKIIYEAFTLNATLSKSPEYLTELGFNVIHDKTANFLDDKQRLTDYDIIVSNPPFETELKQEILKKLVVVDKPFILIMNSMNTFTKYFRTIFGDNIKYLQVITPSGKINFDKLETAPTTAVLYNGDTVSFNHDKYKNKTGVIKKINKKNCKVLINGVIHNINKKFIITPKKPPPPVIEDKLVSTSNCSFYCIYIAYKMNLSNDKLWLD